MFRNLNAEMARAGLANKNLAKTIDASEKSVSNKLCGRTEFTRKEMVAIKITHFPECSLDYLFEEENDAIGINVNATGVRR